MYNNENLVVWFFVGAVVLAIVERAARGNQWVWPAFLLGGAILGGSYLMAHAPDRPPQQHELRIQVSGGLPRL